MLIISGCSAPEDSSVPERAPDVEITRPSLNLGEEGEILLLSRDDFIDPEFYPDFQENYEAEVTEEHYSEDGEAIDIIRSYGDQKSFGLVLLSNFAAQVLIQEGYIAELDRRNIPNLDNIADRFNDLPYDDGNQYCAPVQWSTTGLVYDSTQTSPPERWGALFTSDPASPAFGRISLTDNARVAFAAALMYLGYDVNTTNDREIRAAADVLASSSASRVGFLDKALPEKLATREVALAQGPSKELSPPLETNENLAYALPQEGGILHIDSLCILKTTPPDIKLSAETFINFILEPSNNSALASYNFAASTLTSGRDLLPVGTYGEEFMYPNSLDFVPLRLIQPLGAADLVYQELFEELKSSS